MEFLSFVDWVALGALFCEVVLPPAAVLAAFRLPAFWPLAGVVEWVPACWLLLEMVPPGMSLPLVFGTLVWAKAALLMPNAKRKAGKMREIFIRLA